MSVRHKFEKIRKITSTRVFWKNPLSLVLLALDTWRGKDALARNPVHLHFEPTTRCNLRCTMCEHTFWKEKKIDVSLSQFKEILNQVDGVASVDLTGIGEAILNKEFDALLAEGKRRGLRVRFNDNGTLLDKEWSTRLVELGIDEIHISLDGATKETFEKIREGADFDEIIHNVRQLVEIKNQAGKIAPEIHFICIAMKETVPEIPALIRLASSLGVKYVELQGMITFAENVEHDANEERKAWSRIFDEARGLADSLSIQLTLPSLELKKTKCYHPWFQTYVLADGTVLPCCLYGQRNNREVLKSELAFGNIFKQPFSEIWNNQAYRKIRKELATGDLTGICAKCPIPKGQF